MNLDFDPQKNYYDILGISEDADAAEIKKAYRKAAMQHHPDRNKGDKAAEEKFKEANEANEVLSDPQKKSQYDAFRKGGFGAGGFGGAGGAGFGGFGGGQQVDLGDLLGGFFGGGFGGGGARRSGPERGDDLMMQLTISFEEAYHGLTKEISYSRLQMEEGVEMKICTTCQGAGTVSQQARTPFGVMQTQAACPECGGLGSEAYKDGKKLPNGGLHKVSEKLEITIPAGIKAGSKIRYPGKGNAGLRGGETGDLYIKVLIKGSDKWRRDENNLLVDVDISIYEAVLGGEVTVSHPAGELKVKIPKGLQVGEYVRVTGKGFAQKGLLKSKGDMIVMPKISIPQKLSKAEEKLWKELAKK